MHDCDLCFLNVLLLSCIYVNNIWMGLNKDKSRIIICFSQITRLTQSVFLLNTFSRANLKYHFVIVRLRPLA